MAQETAPAKPLYDVHTHVLFDIDDGAADEAMALEMLRLSSARGVTGIVATPHSQDVREHGGLPTFQDRLERTRALLEDNGIPIELLPGMEVHLMPDVPELLASGDYLPLNGTRYVLIELDFVQWASFTHDLLFQIALDGYVALLAHVERIGPIQERPAVLETLVQRGCFAQVTAASLLGGLGDGPRRTAEALLKRGLVHVIASDAHRPDGNREPLLAAAHDRLVALAGEEAAEAAIYANPTALVRDEPLSPVEPRPRRRRRWWFGPRR